MEGGSSAAECGGVVDGRRADERSRSFIFADGLRCSERPRSRCDEQDSLGQNLLGQGLLGGGDDVAVFAIHQKDNEAERG